MRGFISRVTETGWVRGLSLWVHEHSTRVRGLSLGVHGDRTGKGVISRETWKQDGP